MNLRSDLPVGSPRWATRRTQWKALGLTDGDLDKPKVAVVNSSSGLAPCFSHLDPVAAAVKRSVEQAGGVAFEIRTVAPTDFIMSAGGRGGYVLSSRDLLANDIEAVVDGALLDGMVCLSSCDKTTPGQLMAAARIDVPTLVVSCGYQRSGTADGGEPADIEEVFVQAGHLASGRTTFEGLCYLSSRAIRGPGVCTGMGTANSMHIAAEALGMARPGSTPVRANSERMWAAADAAGATILDAIARDLRPRRVLTAGAFANAVMAMLAVSASINTVKHLQAVAREAETDIDVYRLFEEYAKTVRPLAAVRPNGPDSIEMFEDAGGARAVLHRLREYLHTGALTVTGRTVSEELLGAEVHDGQTIRAVEHPRGDHPTVLVVRGSLAPDTAIVKLSVTERRTPDFRGPARVFEDPAAAIETVEAGRVRRGEVLVLRGLGRLGNPGMGMASSVVFALDGAGLAGHVAVVTDGQLSGLVNQGIVVGEVSPEAADDGPLRLLRDGDEIDIRLPDRRVDLLVDAEELDRRRSQDRRGTGTPGGRPAGWLSLYARSAEPLPKGATLRGR
ncbi:dihydroxy-acid dehydratase domain-containing protein [Allosalinactinospora lopnorensis]|uniref:dihydroxy-acid dehydratase domain-containing protein n=1 Tax=Allosalinactinospora lopnorensis TaxID=1352348 RepID=UPI000623D478|nr:dihydroxy-acid dehydratase [Allosalinactinospora lopnorensis]